MSEKLDKLRQLAQRLKEKVHVPQLNVNSEKVEQILTKYVPASTKVTQLAERFKQEALGLKVKELVTKYEKFTGVEEIMALQNTVIDAQSGRRGKSRPRWRWHYDLDKYHRRWQDMAENREWKKKAEAFAQQWDTNERFMQAQERRRELGRQVASIESRLKELHAEMQNTMKGDEKYLHLCTEEHKLIIQERALRALFSEAEREERELFATMSAAVKLGHERERAHAERNKYWYIVASIFGTVLGIAGSTINNRLKMAEFRDMMEQQMARSASVLYTIAGGGSASRADITEAMKTEFQYQAKLAENMKIMQDTINHLVNKQASVIDHLNHQEHIIESQIRDLKKTVLVASQSSAKSDRELAKTLSEVSDISVRNQTRYDDEEKATASKMSIEPNHVLTAIGVMFCAAIIFGNVIGRVS